MSDEKTPIVLNMEKQKETLAEETELEKIMKENARKKEEQAKKRAEDNKHVLKSYRIK